MTMKHSSQLFAVLGAMAVFVSAAEAIRCYSCTSCSDVSSATNQDCDGACSKTIVEILGVERVSRSCSFSKEANGCSDNSDHGSGVKVCICNEDLCNGSPVTRMSPKMLFILTCITVIIYRLL